MKTFGLQFEITGNIIAINVSSTECFEQLCL